MDGVGFYEFVRTRGHPVLGTAEVALESDDALAAIGLARKENRLILGGDAYYLAARGIEPAYANWHTSQCEDTADCRRRSWAEAERYIGDFPKTGDRKVVFVLVVARREGNAL